MIDLPPPTYQQTIEAIAKCDIPRHNVRIQYEADLQSDEITISNLGPLTDRKMRCLKAAVHPFYILTISDPIQRSAFSEFSRRADRPEEQRSAQEWVRSRGLTDKVPSYDPHVGLKSYADRLEMACGLKVGSTIEIYGTASLTIRRDVILARDVSKLGQTLECLLKIFAASDATENGVSFIFIGNEALAEEKK